MFQLCMPCISEEYKTSVFFHTSKKRKSEFGVRFLVVADEAAAKLTDSFERSFSEMMEQWTLLNSIELFRFLEEKMFKQDCKSKTINCLPGCVNRDQTIQPRYRSE